VLTRKKSNYSSSGDDVKLDLMWSNGVLKPLIDDRETLAVRSAEAEIMTMVKIAWDRGDPYKAKRTEEGVSLDDAVRKALGKRVPPMILATAIRNLKNSRRIKTAKTREKRGFTCGDVGGDLDEQ
jgi:hypothetical protein